jgi:hypothetical protein
MHIGFSLAAPYHFGIAERAFHNGCCFFGFIDLSNQFVQPGFNLFSSFFFHSSFFICVGVIVQYITVRKNTAEMEIGVERSGHAAFIYPKPPAHAGLYTIETKPCQFAS